jgi:hypothetical protein
MLIKIIFLHFQYIKDAIFKTEFIYLTGAPETLFSNFQKIYMYGTGAI